MSLVIAVPELLAEAATKLETMGSALNEAQTAAAAATVAVSPAAADEVSSGIARLFSDFGQEYEEVARQAAVFHEEFAQHLNVSAGAYASAEAVNVALLQPVTQIMESILVASGMPQAIRALLLRAYLPLEAALWTFFAETSFGSLLGGALVIGLIIGVIGWILFWLVVYGFVFELIEALGSFGIDGGIGILRIFFSALLPTSGALSANA